MQNSDAAERHSWTSGGPVAAGLGAPAQISSGANQMAAAGTGWPIHDIREFQIAAGS